MENQATHGGDPVAFILGLLKYRRLALGLSQDRVRQETGIDVSHYETGRSEPGLRVVIRLCHYYDLHPKALFEPAYTLDFEEFTGQ